MGLSDKARAIAVMAHEGQLDKAGRPYIEHPCAVAAQAAIYGEGDETLIAAAWLHDVIEDSEWTAEALLAEGFPAEVVELVEAVSRREGETYLEDFIPRVIASGQKAVLLKLADIWHNSHPSRAASRPPKLEERYAKAHELLMRALVVGAK